MAKENDSLDYDGSSVDPKYSGFGDKGTMGYVDKQNVGTRSMDKDRYRIHPSFPRPMNSDGTGYLNYDSYDDNHEGDE